MAKDDLSEAVRTVEQVAQQRLLLRMQLPRTGAPQTHGGRQPPVLADQDEEAHLFPDAQGVAVQPEA